MEHIDIKRLALSNIEGLQAPIIWGLSAVLLVLTSALPFQIANGNLQSIPFYIYYLTVIPFVIFLTVKKDFLSPLFAGTLVSIILSLLGNTSVFFQGIQTHRDYFPGADIDIAVIKKYLIETASFVMICITYYQFPTKIGVTLKDFKLEGREKNLFIATIIMLGLVLFVFTDFANRAGGIINALAQRALSKDDKVSGQIGSHHSFVINQSYLISLIWLLLDKTLYKRSFFWLNIGFYVLIGYFITGSRGGFLGKALIIGYVVVLIIGKFNIKKVSILALPILLLIGYQSANRFVKADELKSMSTLEIASSALEGIDKTFDEANKRGGDADSTVGMYMNVPNNLPYQYGYTYISIALIPFPSAILPFKKTNAAGYHYVNQLRGRTDTAWPIGSLGEAYWNFSYFGILFYSVIMGIVYKISYNILQKSNFSAIALYIHLCVTFKFSLASDGMYSFAHMLIFGLLAYCFYNVASKVRL
jgi:hypothetical protein